MKKRVLLSAIASLVLSSSLSALTLNESVKEILDTSPIVKERLSHIREVQQDLNIAESEYYPSVDFKASIGQNSSGKLNNDVESESYMHYTNSLKITQNIFNGFSTTHKVDYQKSRILAAAYHYIENANDVAFQMVGVYLDAIRSYRLLQNAIDNVKVHEKIFRDVKSLYKNGLTNKSEMTKIRASLALAKSNLVVQRNNTIDKEFRFKRLLGRNIDISELTLPKLDFAMPESMQRATQYAIKHNPSILVSGYNIKGAQNLYKEKKSKYYPRVDLEVEQMYNDSDKDNTFDSADDRLRAYLSVSWNLYKGGAHKSDIQKSRSSINREVEIQRDLKRQTIESLELSWSAYHMIGEQLDMLYRYSQYNKETLANYKSEYEMGKRTLLDLLSVQSDLINSKNQIINAQTDKLYAQYRILDAMGLLVSSLLDEASYDEIVSVTKNPYDVKEDKLPVRLDVDGDKIVDSLDICDNSAKGVNIKPYGCVQKELDTDFDGVPDTRDVCPDTKIGYQVDNQGCKVLDSKNKFEADEKSYINEVIKYTDQSPVKSNKLGLHDYEYNWNPSKNVRSSSLDNKLMYGNYKLIKRFGFIDMNSANLSDDNFDGQLSGIARAIKDNENDDIIVMIIGNTRDMKNVEASNDKALEYAQDIKNMLIQKGVDGENLIAKARGDKDNLFLQTDNYKLNDVVAVSLYVKGQPQTYRAQEQQEIIEEVVLDDDQDGVSNDMDSCPNTLSGHKVDRNGCATKINLEVLFERNSNKIRKDSVDKILEFASFLKENPNYNTIIVGHASVDTATSSASYNKKLSLKRANSVKWFLVKHGVSSSRIKTKGMGFSQPIASNATEEGRILNRRIEAEIINKAR